MYKTKIITKKIVVDFTLNHFDKFKKFLVVLHENNSITSKLFKQLSELNQEDVKELTKKVENDYFMKIQNLAIENKMAKTLKKNRNMNGGEKVKKEDIWKCTRNQNFDWSKFFEMMSVKMESNRPAADLRVAAENAIPSLEIDMTENSITLPKLIKVVRHLGGEMTKEEVLEYINGLEYLDPITFEELGMGWAEEDDILKDDYCFNRSTILNADGSFKPHMDEHPFTRQRWSDSMLRPLNFPYQTGPTNSAVAITLSAIFAAEGMSFLLQDNIAAPYIFLPQVVALLCVAFHRFYFDHLGRLRSRWGGKLCKKRKMKRKRTKKRTKRRTKKRTKRRKKRRRTKRRRR